MPRKTGWGPQNPLWRWQHRKANKSQTRHKSTVRHMAKRRRTRSYGRRLARRFRRGKDHHIPILPTVAALAPAFSAYQHAGSVEGIFQDPMGFGKQVLYEYTGYDINNGTFNAGQLVTTLMGVGAGYVAHKVMDKVGVNRAIHKLPLVGKYISL